MRFTEKKIGQFDPLRSNKENAAELSFRAVNLRDFVLYVSVVKKETFLCYLRAIF